MYRTQRAFATNRASLVAHDHFAAQTDPASLTVPQLVRGLASYPVVMSSIWSFNRYAVNCAWADTGATMISARGKLGKFCGSVQWVNPSPKEVIPNRNGPKAISAGSGF